MKHSDMCAFITKKTGKPCFYCILCHEYFYGYGNNPYPLTNDEDAECCDDCNATKVIPARLARL